VNRDPIGQGRTRKISALNEPTPASEKARRLAGLFALQFCCEYSQGPYGASCDSTDSSLSRRRVRKSSHDVPSEMIPAQPSTSTIVLPPWLESTTSMVKARAMPSRHASTEMTIATRRNTMTFNHPGAFGSKRRTKAKIRKANSPSTTQASTNAELMDPLMSATTTLSAGSQRSSAATPSSNVAMIPMIILNFRAATNIRTYFNNRLLNNTSAT
jgi:hypothetical protein